MSYYDTLVMMVLSRGYRRATKYLSPTQVITCCARWKPSRRARSTELVIKIGRPNYAEREFIKACQKAGEPFPVRKIQLKSWGDNRKK